VAAFDENGMRRRPIPGPLARWWPPGRVLLRDQRLVAGFAPRRVCAGELADGELLGDPVLSGPEPESPLTPREVEVLELAAEGRNGPMIAQELILSAATVRTHFGHIYAKLGVPDRAAAVARAMRLGLIA
jgi:ATP/maltotriose-dependent transcriptional regulator MalT